MFPTAHARALEGRHLTQHERRRTKCWNCQRGARSFAEPHPKVEKTMKLEHIELHGVPRLWRAVRRNEKRTNCWAQPHTRERGRGRDEPIENHSSACGGGGEDHAHKARDLEAADFPEYAERARISRHACDRVRNDV